MIFLTTGGATLIFIGILTTSSGYFNQMISLNSFNSVIRARITGGVLKLITENELEIFELYQVAVIFFSGKAFN